MKPKPYHLTVKTGEKVPDLVPQLGNQNADFGPPDPAWIAKRAVDRWSVCDNHIRDVTK